ncbi:MAG: SURF1 family protein [Pseudomonadota bacterium]
MSAQSQTTSNKWLWLALIFGAVALVILISLGTWQVKRLAWKEALLATIEERTNQQPLALANVLAKLQAGEEIEYTPVKTLGYFDHANEQHFFATFDGLSGYYIYTPLMLEAERFVFVNRGFVPFDMKDPGTRPESLVSLSQDVTGLARSVPDDKAGWVVPDNDVEKNVFHWKDLDAMIERTGKPAEQFVPIFIDQDNKANPTQLPVGGVTIIDLPNNHLQYAVTWYGLALTLIGVLGFYVVRHRRGA